MNHLNIQYVVERMERIRRYSPVFVALYVVMVAALLWSVCFVSAGPLATSYGLLLLGFASSSGWFGWVMSRPYVSKLHSAEPLAEELHQRIQSLKHPLFAVAFTSIGVAGCGVIMAVTHQGPFWFTTLPCIAATLLMRRMPQLYRFTRAVFRARKSEWYDRWHPAQ